MGSLFWESHVLFADPFFSFWEGVRKPTLQDPVSLITISQTSLISIDGMEIFVYVCFCLWSFSQLLFNMLSWETVKLRINAYDLLDVRCNFCETNDIWYDLRKFSWHIVKHILETWKIQSVIYILFQWGFGTRKPHRSQLSLITHLDSDLHFQGVRSLRDNSI